MNKKKNVYLKNGLIRRNQIRLIVDFLSFSPGISDMTTPRSLANKRKLYMNYISLLKYLERET